MGLRYRDETIIEQLSEYRDLVQAELEDARFRYLCNDENYNRLEVVRLQNKLAAAERNIQVVEALPAAPPVVYVSPRPPAETGGTTLRPPRGQDPIEAEEQTRAMTMEEFQALEEDPA